MLTQQQIAGIKAVLQDSRFVQEAWLFGSYAKNKETSESDIDIMYCKVPGVRYGFFALMEVILKLESITGKKIDFVHAPTMKGIVKNDADKYRLKIYERK